MTTGTKKQKKRKRYSVHDDNGETVGRSASITSAVIASYKLARRHSSAFHIYRGYKWLATITGA